jgi:hypothetical protein
MSSALAAHRAAALQVRGLGDCRRRCKAHMAASAPGVARAGEGSCSCSHRLSLTLSPLFSRAFGKKPTHTPGPRRHPGPPWRPDRPHRHCARRGRGGAQGGAQGRAHCQGEPPERRMCGDACCKKRHTSRISAGAFGPQRRRAPLSRAADPTMRGLGGCFCGRGCVSTATRRRRVSRWPARIPRASPTLSAQRSRPCPPLAHRHPSTPTHTPVSPTPHQLPQKDRSNDTLIFASEQSLR